MDEMKLIQMLAGPILEVLESIESSRSGVPMKALPEIRVLADPDMELAEVAGVKIDAALFAHLEAYLQQELEKSSRPMVLH